MRFLALSPSEKDPRRKTHCIHLDFSMNFPTHTSMAHPVRYGYVNVTDMKAMGKLAEFLTLEPDVVSKEMKVTSLEKTKKKSRVKQGGFTPKNDSNIITPT